MTVHLNSLWLRKLLAIRRRPTRVLPGPIGRRYLGVMVEPVEQSSR